MNEMKHPDPKAHLHISLVKSAVRIMACVIAIITGSLIILAVGLGIAEAIGILEELV